MFNQITRQFVDELIARKLNVSRQVKDDELFTVNPWRVKVKAVITFILLTLIFLFLGTKAVVPGYTVSFSCNETLVSDGLNFAEMSKRQRLYYCSVRWAFTSAALVAYIPLGIEFIQLSIIIAISLISPSIYIPIVDDEYVGYAENFPSDETFYCCWHSMVCYLCCQLKEVTKSGSGIFLAGLILILDVLFAFALFPVIFLVLTASGNIESQIVDFVAVQVFLTVANELSKSLFFQRLSVGEKLRFVVDGNPSLDPPRYWPYDRVYAEARQQHFGVKSDRPGAHLLRDAENYKGFSAANHWYKEG